MAVERRQHGAYTIRANVPSRLRVALSRLESLQGYREDDAVLALALYGAKRLGRLEERDPAEAVRVVREIVDDLGTRLKEGFDV